MENCGENNSFRNQPGLNLEWSLFDVTLRSYKSHSYLNEEVIKHGNKEFLENLSTKISEIIQQPVNHLPHDCTEFFRLVRKHQKFKLSLVSTRELEKYLNLFAPRNASKENFILFKITEIERFAKSDTLNLVKNLNELREQFGSFDAIHGSNMNRFYSILQNGLRLPHHSDMPGLFGCGIYLTNKLDVAHHFAQAHIFEHGIFEGYSLKAVAICDVIKHPTTVVRHNHCSADEFSLNGGLPSEYFLVKDENMVRVTHILIHSSIPISDIGSRLNSEPRLRVIPFQTTQNYIQTLRKHWLWFTIFTYIMLLIIISYCTGKSVIFSNWHTSDLLDINNN